MRAVVIVLCLAGSVGAASAGPDEHQRIREVRFTGVQAADQMCACLLEARAAAEVQGRIDFSAEVTIAADQDLSARIWMGPARSVGRIHFTGHDGVNDS